MRIRLLGTGAADGLPNPFCRCATCDEARTSGRIRTRSSAIIDHRLLIDPGPDVAVQVAHLGVDLLDVRHWFITHGHPDHLDPMLLLLRHWVAADVPLRVWGPPSALQRINDWLAPGAPIELTEARPGEEFELSIDGIGYQAHAHRADHNSKGIHDSLSADALLWSFERDGNSLLYATDTGPEPDVRGGPYRLVLLDSTFGPKSDHGTGHLHFETTRGLLEKWRISRIIDESTRTIATHISHHNPPYAELRERLTELGIDLVDDGFEWEIGRSHTRRVLFTGGMRSGKSRAAELVAARYPMVHYVATARPRVDPEWSARVREHQGRRPVHWHTHETSDPIPVIAQARAGECVLIDCLTLWLTHLLDDLDAWNRLDERDVLNKEVETANSRLIEAIECSAADVICVTNEIGMSIIPIDPGSRLFADLMGRTSAAISDIMTDVFLVVAGRPMALPVATRAIADGAHA